MLRGRISPAFVDGMLVGDVGQSHDGHVDSGQHSPSMPVGIHQYRPVPDFRQRASALDVIDEQHRGGGLRAFKDESDQAVAFRPIRPQPVSAHPHTATTAAATSSPPPDRTSPSPDIRGEHAELRFREFLVN